MTRTRSTTLIALLIAGAAVGWFAENALVMSGRPLLVPPLTLGATLLIVGIVLLGLAWPIRQATRGRRPGRVDPFRATRVVLLAKASALAGALLAGITGGVLAFVLARPVLPGASSVGLAVAGTVGAVVLLVAGLVAEHWCTVPPDDRDDARPGDPARELS
ncbi:DUF3180 domain-containing protein [Clavibacter tessellarius]|uniref:DUF3180 domain-containing protein n=1 Tax=Clavibacter tessellarius TaxID=31965 RepID=A0A225CAM8_9MICO|nr:DUF3180 domain-containing protein [Clavibacter michiganensis]MBT1636185.1 DUF3180 family protein [Clavibacter michiganensis]OQJ61781.1 hypothetical protein B5P24_01380 [Clavibacter michiganensis subsp. tessellarius]UKF32526.1 DUF3180 domain-containing protein [Clavibacter michiganensis subsp. tessellarius]